MAVERHCFIAQMTTVSLLIHPGLGLALSDLEYIVAKFFRR